jgi:TRAP-type C4-dicarboxylate transport system substrate-binding protein
MIPALQTGMIEAFDVPPLFALLDQSFGLARNMIPIRWAPLVGATVVSKRTWERLPEEMRGPMLEAARDAGHQRREEIRRMGEESVSEMVKRGMKVVDLDSETRSAWRAEAEAAYPRLRGSLIPAELFDEAVRLQQRFRTEISARAGEGSKK